MTRNTFAIQQDSECHEYVSPTVTEVTQNHQGGNREILIMLIKESVEPVWKSTSSISQSPALRVSDFSVPHSTYISYLATGTNLSP